MPSETKAKTLLVTEHAAYFAQKSVNGMAVYTGGTTKRYSDGSQTFSMRMPICIITDYCSDPLEAAQEIAAALNAAEGLPKSEPAASGDAQ